MVKIERKDTPKAQAAIASLKSEKVKPSGTYNTPEVMMLFKKCLHISAISVSKKD